MKNITATKARDDLLLGVQQGNHKGAVNHPIPLQDPLKKDVHHGFALPIKISTAKKLPGARWAPLNTIDQWTTKPEGNMK
jgi:hypothetical protein